MKRIERDIRGRVVVFFPGEYEDSNYRLAGRKGWVELPRSPDHPA